MPSGETMRKALLLASLAVSAWLCCGDAMAQSGGGQSSGARTTQGSGNKSSDWFTTALRQLGACYRTAMERLQEQDHKVTGEYQKDILKCNQSQQTAKECVDAARKKMNDAKLPIDQKRVDVTTTYQNLQGRLQTARANGGTCTSGGCCTNELGTSAPAVGPDGRACTMQGSPQGWGNCDANFQNMLGGY